MEKSDFLVVGAGLAGLAFALEAARHGSVTILAKTTAEESNTRYAQGGIAAVMDPSDRPESHVQDTLVAGAGLCRREVVELCVKEGPDRLNELMALGVPFSRDTAGHLDLGREGGHSTRRVLHVKDRTGAAVVETLLPVVRAHPRIRLFENHIAVDLIHAAWLARRKDRVPPVPNEVHGAYVLDRRTGRVKVFAARVVVLCTGGAGKVYLYTSNPDIASGDGIAMAWRAGVRIANMEFIQFHPTCLYHPQAKNFLITEAMRGEGGVLRRADGGTFMERYDPRRELAPRDVVARAIDAELKRTGEECVFLDMTHHPRAFLSSRFPTVYERCASLGIDIAAQPIPVVPAAHYCCGGVDVDLFGESSIRGLYAVGETSCTGLHGANRLASNSLLEAVVFARRAAVSGAERIREMDLRTDLPAWDPGGAVDADEQVLITQTWDEIRRCMWSYVGIVRTNRRLERARHRVDLLNDEIQEYYWDTRLTADLVELRNLATVAGLVVESALRRQESRGLHWTADFPRTDERFLHDTVLERRL
ncbi:MAG: L-aspartate oxidase [Deltaproteobacteria bacterium]|nr:L-aspartate oxidase [Deltaproteobacteria bacterium]